MAVGAFLQLAAYGAQDVYLTGQPKSTFFQAVYKRHTNFAMQAIKLEQQFSFINGSITSVKVDRAGDLMGDVWLELPVQPNLNLSSNGLNPDTCWIAERAIKKIEFLIGGQVIDVHYQTWWRLWSECFLDKSKRLDYSKMTSLPTQTAGTVLLPLLFSFCRNPGLFLPLVALQNHEVRLNFEVSDTYSSYFTGPPNIWVNFVFLDQQERKLFAQNSHEYLIEQVQHTGGDVLTSLKSRTLTRFTNPVKELVWCYQNSTLTNPDSMWNFSTDSAAAVSCAPTQGFVGGSSNVTYPSVELLNFYVARFTTNDTPVYGLYFSPDVSPIKNFLNSSDPNTQNVYVYGGYRGIANVYNVLDQTNELKFSGNVLPFTGDHNLFLAQFDSSGNPVNCVYLSSAQNIINAGITVANSNVYITGLYSGFLNVFSVNTGSRLNFNNNYFQASSGNRDGFIMKFDSSLNPISAIAFQDSPSSIESISPVSYDGFIDCIVCSLTYQGTVNIININTNSELKFNGTSLLPNSFSNVYGAVVRYSSDLDVSPVGMVIQGTNITNVLSTFDQHANVFVSVNYTNSSNLVIKNVGSGSLIQFGGNNVGPGTQSSFIAKTDSTFNSSYFADQFINSSGFFDVNSISILNSSSNVVITGTYDYSVGTINIWSVNSQTQMKLNSNTFPPPDDTSTNNGFIASFDPISGTWNNGIYITPLVSGPGTIINPLTVKTFPTSFLISGNYLSFDTSNIINVSNGSVMNTLPNTDGNEWGFQLGITSNFSSVYDTLTIQGIGDVKTIDATSSITSSSNNFVISGTYTLTANIFQGSTEIFFSGSSTVNYTILPHRVGVPYISGVPFEETYGPLSLFTLFMNSQERFKPQTGKYFNQYQPYQYHSGAPYAGIYSYSFALRPEEHQPSGACNFSRISKTEAYSELKTQPRIQKLFAVNYNILRIKSGMGGLAFAN